MLGAFLDKAAGTLTPLNSNPAEGELFSSLTIAYSENGSSEEEPLESLCFDLVSGSDTFEEIANVTEKVDNDLTIKIKSNDLHRDSLADQLCSSECGGPNNPTLEGAGNSEYYSIRNYTSLQQGGCGADYLDYCGDCPNQTYCYGDGTEPIEVEHTTTETYEWSVDGCREFVEPSSAADYPSAEGTLTTTTTIAANCCFSFVCNGEVNSSPSPNPYSNTVTSTPYNVIDVTNDYLENTTTTPIEPIDISDVTDAAFEKLGEVEYFAPEGGYFWVYGSPNYASQLYGLQVSHTRYSKPFSEYGFANLAEVTLSEKQYIIRIGEPPPTCYIKLWFVEEFLPNPIPENWEIGLDGHPIPQRLASFEIEHDFGSGGVIPKSCYKDTDINFEGEDQSFVPENSTLLEGVRTLNTPEERGTTAVKLLKYSLLKNYVPNDPYLHEDVHLQSVYYTQDCKPNGYPYPEAAVYGQLQGISCE